MRQKKGREREKLGRRNREEEKLTAKKRKGKLREVRIKIKAQTHAESILFLPGDIYIYIINKRSRAT